MAIACLRLRTRPPEPERSVPRFRLRIALSTLDDAFFEYRLRFVVVAMDPPASKLFVGLSSFDTRRELHSFVDETRAEY
jgi:hypothetical protein